MSQNSAKIVSYTNSLGFNQFGTVAIKDQHPELQVIKKVAVRLLSQDLTPQLDENGIQKKVVVLGDKLKVVGYQD